MNPPQFPGGYLHTDWLSKQLPPRHQNNQQNQLSSSLRIVNVVVVVFAVHCLAVVVDSEQTGVFGSREWQSERETRQLKAKTRLSNSHNISFVFSFFLVLFHCVKLSGACYEPEPRGESYSYPSFHRMGILLFL